MALLPYPCFFVGPSNRTHPTSLLESAIGSLHVYALTQYLQSESLGMDCVRTHLRMLGSVTLCSSPKDSCKMDQPHSWHKYAATAVVSACVWPAGGGTRV